MSASKETILYVTREIERALGMAPNQNYRIVSNKTPFGETIQSRYPEFVTLIQPEGPELLGTGDLITHRVTSDLVAKITASIGTRPYLLVFKNTLRIEPLTRDKGWTLINPPASTSEKVENKISQILWLQDLEKYLPPHRIIISRNVRWGGSPFVLQWAHGHTGDGTILIDSEEKLNALKEKFPERRCRITDFISGPSYTLNVVVTPERVIPSTVSYQITGMAPFTESAFATVGNDWSLANRTLSQEDRNWIQVIVNQVGARMQKDFWRGLFGLDFMKDEKTGKLYLIEINARQPASTAFESYLQETLRNEGKVQGVTTFEAHIEALMGRPVTKSLIPINEGSQLVQRVTKSVPQISENTLKLLDTAGFKTVKYSNTEDNSDLLRIQSTKGVMNSHNEFNENGKNIVDALKLS